MKRPDRAGKVDFHEEDFNSMKLFYMLPIAFFAWVIGAFITAFWLLAVVLFITAPFWIGGLLVWWLT